jgi:hypothetical protein
MRENDTHKKHVVFPLQTITRPGFFS